MGASEGDGHDRRKKRSKARNGGEHMCQCSRHCKSRSKEDEKLRVKAKRTTARLYQKKYIIQCTHQYQTINISKGTIHSTALFKDIAITRLARYQLAG